MCVFGRGLLEDEAGQLADGYQRHIVHDRGGRETVAQVMKPEIKHGTGSTEAVPPRI